MARIQEWSTEDLERRAVELRVKAEGLEELGYTAEAEEPRRIYGAMSKELLIRNGKIAQPTREFLQRIGFSQTEIERYEKLHGQLA